MRIVVCQNSNVTPVNGSEEMVRGFVTKHNFDCKTLVRRLQVQEISKQDV
jgi:hypothetical protein